MTDNILYHGYTYDKPRPRLDLADYDTPVYPPRIRAAADEVRARRAVWQDYIQHSKEIGILEWDALQALVVDAADAEDALINLLGVWQSAALAENTSMIQWMEEVG